VLYYCGEIELKERMIAAAQGDVDRPQ